MAYCRHFSLAAILCAGFSQPVCAAADAQPYSHMSDPAESQISSPLEEGRIDRMQPVVTLESAEPSKPAPNAATQVDAGDPDAPAIRNISFVGTDVPTIVAKAAQQFIGQSATRETLKAITAAMSEAYARSDVALFTLVIPNQDLSSGNVRVFVAEGYIQSVVLEGEVEGRSLKMVKAYADKMLREQPTSRRTIERYLSLIRDIPGLTVEPRLETGQGRGAVKLTLKLDYKKPTASFGFDNRSTRLINGGQFEARAVAFGLLRDGDRTEVTGTASVDFHDLLYIGVSHSTPIGTEGARATLSYGHLETRPSGTPISGNADTFGLTFTYPIIRSYKRNLSATFALDGVNSDNTAFGSILATEKTRAARAALGYSLSNRRTAVGGGVTVSQGLDMLGAEVDRLRAKGDFLKVNLRASLAQAVSKSLFVRLNGSAQWTDDPLPAVERFSVGGATFGRAFERGLINADRGYAGLMEVAYRPLKAGPFRQSELYVFADYADVALLARQLSPKQSLDLASTGGGMRLGYREDAMLGVEAARTIDKPYPGYRSKWRFSITWRYSLRP